MTPEEVWVQVRPGESFPQYNARIKAGEKPFTVPPKIIQTTPGTIDDTQSVTGSQRKERRKGYLREKKKSSKTKNDKDAFGSSTSQKRPLSIDVVKEPARLTSKPKETLKIHQRQTHLRHITDLAETIE